MLFIVLFWCLFFLFGIHHFLIHFLLPFFVFFQILLVLKLNVHKLNIDIFLTVEQSCLFDRLERTFIVFQFFVGQSNTVVGLEVLRISHQNVLSKLDGKLEISDIVITQTQVV